MKAARILSGALATGIGNGTLTLLTGCALFAVFDVLTKGLVHAFSPAEMAFYRFAVSSLLLSPHLFRRRSWPSRQDLPYFLIRGVFGAASFYCWILAVQCSSLAVSIILAYSAPLWSLVFGAFLLHEAITARRLLGILGAICGITILVNPWHEGVAPGHIFALAVGVFFGANNVVTRHLRRRHSSRTIAAHQNFMGMLLCLPLYLLEGQGPPEWVTGGLLLTGILCSLLGQLLVINAFRFIRAAEGATLMMTEAVFATTLGVMVLREALTSSFFLGATLVVGSGAYLGLQKGATVAK